MKPILLCLLLAGCANGRYLTPQEDADMRKNCEKVGCTVVPNPILLQLLNRLEGRAI